MSGYAFFVQESATQPKGTWARNGMIFATESEAKQYGCDLLSRWFGICGGEVREVAEVPTYKWVDGRAISLPQQICEVAEAEDSVGPCRGSARTICPDCATSSDWATGSHVCPSCGSRGPAIPSPGGRP